MKQPDFVLNCLVEKSSLLNNASTEQCSYAQVILMTGLDQCVLPVNLFWPMNAILFLFISGSHFFLFT